MVVEVVTVVIGVDTPSSSSLVKGFASSLVEEVVVVVANVVVSKVVVSSTTGDSVIGD